MHRLRGLAVAVEVRAHDHQLRTQCQRARRWHGGAYTKGTRFVIAGGDDAASSGIATDSQRLAPVAWLVTGLDGGVETIAVDMDDFSCHANRSVCARM